MYTESIKFDNGLPVQALVRSGSLSSYHWHDALEILQVLKGSTGIIIGDDEIILHQGDIAIVNINELHRMTGGDGEILFLYIDGCFCRSILTDRYMFFYCCSPRHEELVPEKYGVLEDYISRLTDLIDANQRSANSANVKKLLQEMLSYTSYHFDFLRWGFGGKPFSDKCVARFYQIAQYTTNDMEVQKNLTELASELGISIQHLSGEIRKKFGMTFQELLCYSRCERAARLLLSTDMRIVEIAADCGFSDVKYLVLEKI